MTMEDQIRTKLETGLSPRSLRVTNESHLHAGHAGDDGTGESHWSVEIAADALDGQSRIAKHRAVHAALGPEIITRIHALALKID